MIIIVKISDTKCSDFTCCLSIISKNTIRCYLSTAIHWFTLQLSTSLISRHLIDFLPLCLEQGLLPPFLAVLGNRSGARVKLVLHPHLEVEIITANVPTSMTFQIQAFKSEYTQLCMRMWKKQSVCYCFLSSGVSCPKQQDTTCIYRLRGEA